MFPTRSATSGRGNRKEESGLVETLRRDPRAAFLFPAQRAAFLFPTRSSEETCGPCCLRAQRQRGNMRQVSLARSYFLRGRQTNQLQPTSCYTLIHKYSCTGGAPWFGGPGAAAPPPPPPPPPPRPAGPPAAP